MLQPQSNYLRAIMYLSITYFLWQSQAGNLTCGSLVSCIHVYSVAVWGLCITELVTSIVTQQFVIFGGSTVGAAVITPRLWPSINDDLPRATIWKHVVICLKKSMNIREVKYHLMISVSNLKSNTKAEAFRVQDWLHLSMRKKYLNRKGIVAVLCHHHSM